MGQYFLPEPLFLLRKRIFTNAISFSQSLMIFCRILFRIVSWENIFLSVFSIFSNDTDKLSFPANNYLFKVSNKKSRKSYEVCLKLIVKTPERCQ